MDKAHLLRGVEQFNNGFFFEAHDILEDLWMETTGRDKLFLQGLIQVSVGFYHLFNANMKGARSQLSKGLHKLEQYKPAHAGVELDLFTAEVKRWHTIAVDAVHGQPVPYNESDVPRICVVPITGELN